VELGIELFLRVQNKEIDCRAPSNACAPKRRGIMTSKVAVGVLSGSVSPHFTLSHVGPSVAEGVLRRDKVTGRANLAVKIRDFQTV